MLDMIRNLVTNVKDALGIEVPDVPVDLSGVTDATSGIGDMATGAGDAVTEIRPPL